MDKEHLQELDYGIAMSAQSIIKAFGMLSENMDRISRGEEVKYHDSEFDKLIEDNGVYHNAVITRWNRLSF